ncbi:syntaxin, Qa-SNARE family (SYN13) [Plasmodium ovale curtisi]|uniref:Syntaxin, Qa-SNARE family (SYN13) n=1 Tax=Plasmodium ovale curtisi TaxID=864141 RepID=A0A1A8WDV9_PLAOA|nr:syntaxin, Qa-SNARE family (SYN13) [Plasmodium ovale curtisi]
MSYSTKKRENKNLLKKKNAHSFEFNSEIQNDIGNEDEGCSIESSEKVQEIVQEGKLKIQEIQKKLKNYSSSADNIPQHEKVSAFGNMHTYVYGE